MAQLELANGSTEDVLVFAREILLFQAYEIGLLDATLDRWGYEREQAPERSMAWMGMTTSPESMPGMASTGELDALRSGEGPGADALFLRLMQDHHQGGAHMAEFAAENVDDEEVRRLAELMARTQRLEIIELETARQRIGLPSNPAGYGR